MGRATAARALSELLDIRMQFGKLEELETLTAQVKGREMSGGVVQRLAQADRAIWVLKHAHHEAIASAAVSVDNFMGYGKKDHKQHAEVAKFHATHDGASLADVKALTGRVGLKMQMAKRDGGDFVVPSIVHLKAGHFTALVKQEGDRFLLADPMLGGEVWMSRAALQEEASGYSLLPEGRVRGGWKSAKASEVQGIRGKCVAAMPNYGCTLGCCSQTGGPPPCSGKCRMATYTFHALLVSLRIADSPVGYTPPRGPAIEFEVTYNQREAYQPAIFPFSNFGPRWNFGWLSYIEDMPSNLSAPVNVHVPGGGREVASGFSVDRYLPNFDSRAVIVRTSSAPIRYERQLPDGSMEVYSQPDTGVSPRRVFLTERRDTAGNAAQVTYDAQLRVAAITDAIGQVTTLTYGLSDPLLIAKVTDPFSRSANFAYNSDGRLIRITDVIGITSEFEYGNDDFIRALTTPYGTTTFAHGLVGFGFPIVYPTLWVEATDPLGGTERIEYDWHAPELAASDPASTVPNGFVNNVNLDRRNTYYWDKRAMALHPGDHTKAKIMHWLWSPESAMKVVDALHSEKLSLENRVWYGQMGEAVGEGSSPKGQPAKVGRVLDDGGSQIYRYEYGPRGNKTRETDPLGRETVYEYDPGNDIDLLRIKRKNGANYDLLQTLTYNSQHRPLTRTDGSGQTTTYTYNSQGQIATVTTPPRAGITENRIATYTHDTNGYLQSISGPAVGQTSSFTYDGYGRLRSATDAEGHTTTYDYDALDRVTKTTYPDGTYGETVYNRLDPEKRRDRLGRWTHIFYDALRRVVATRDPLGRTTTRQWCTCGSLDKLIDANGNAITWERDIQGRVTREIRADGSDLDFVYENTTSRPKQVTDPKSQVIGYEYFADNNLKQTTYTNAQNPTANVNFTYDPSYNRPVTMVDGTGTTSYTYHPVTTPPTLGSGRLASVDGPLANDTMTYTYDELGRRTGRLINGVATTQAYDTLGRVDSEVTPIGTFTYSYVGVTGRLSGITYPNGQTTAYAYLGNVGDHRLQDIHNQLSGGATLSRFQYTYDADGSIKTWTQQAGAGPAQVYELGYDGADQLTGATLKTTDPTPAILKRYAYDYDKASNRTTEQIDDSAMAATYNNMDRLLSQQPGGALRFAGTVNEPATVTIQAKPAQVTSDNRFTGSASVPSGTSTVEVKATDPSGNLRTNTYQVSLAGASKSFSYDANGDLTGDGARGFEWDAEDRLVAVTLGTHRSEFTYDGKGRRVRIVEKDNGVVTEERWLLWCDESICEERDAGGGTVRKRFFERGVQEDGVSYYYAKDHLGSVREMTDASGTVRARYDYDPYGRVIKTTGDKDTPFRFTGHYYHSPSSLTLTFHRAYDSAMGRWISQDPVGPVDGTNLYAYVQNDPVNYLDPLGLFQLKDEIKQVRTMGIGQVCPATSGGACTRGVYALYYCTCTETSCDNPESKVDQSTLYVRGTMYIFSGPWPMLKKKPKDKTVKDADSAIAHEYNVHINPAVAAVTPLIEAFEGKSFKSKAECEGECRETQAKVSKLFAETLRKTQQQENQGP